MQPLPAASRSVERGMSSDLQKPHDGLFQWTFSNLERAHAEFGAIIPAGLLRHLDLSTLALTTVSRLSERRQDLWRGGQNRVVA
jgi:hypothetical protein